MEKLIIKAQQLDKPFTFSGRANSANVVDRQNDRVLPFAWTDSIRENDGKIKILYQHNPIFLIGDASVAEDARGNLIVTEGRLVQGVQLAEEAHLLLKAGVLNALSVGFDVREDRYTRDGVREIVKANLWEVSLVTWGASPGAIVDRVKDNNPAIEALASWIRSMKNAAEAEQLRSAMRTANVAARNAKERAEADQLRNRLLAIRTLRTRVR